MYYELLMEIDEVDVQAYNKYTQNSTCLLTSLSICLFKSPKLNTNTLPNSALKNIIESMNMNSKSQFDK